MYLLESWKDSLSLFKPSNFKMFALVTAKTIKETYWLLLKYFWWMPVLAVALFFILIPHMGIEGAAGLFFLIPHLFFFAWKIIACLCARPSVAKKSYAYFGKYILHAISIIVGSLLMRYLVGFLFALLFLLASSLGLEESVIGLWWILSLMMEPALVLVQLFFIFFVLDMSFGVKNAAKSILFALKMFWYNLPALYLIFSAGFGLYLLAIWFLRFLLALVLDVHHVELSLMFLPIVTLPIIVSVIANLYTKRLHEQPQLYFARPKE